MQVMLILNALFALALALAIAITVVVLGYRVFMRLNPSIDEEAELRRNNVAVAIVTGAFIFALGWLMRSVIEPISQTMFAMVFSFQMSGFGLLQLATTAGLVLAQFFAALAIAFSALWLGTRGFMWLNRNTDETGEIAENNVAVAVLVAFITITFAVVLEPGTSRLLEVMIPTPEVRNDDLRPFG